MTGRSPAASPAATWFQPDPPLAPAARRKRQSRNTVLRRAAGLLLQSGIGFGALWVACVLPETASGQAVSKPNWDISPSGGTLDGRSGRLLEGEFAIPLAPDFGFEAKGVGGKAAGSGYWGVTGDFFWRNPSIGALGPIVLYEQNGGLKVQHYGFGGNFYRGPVDLSLRAGYQGGNVRTGGFVELKGGLYITPDLEVATATQNNAGVFVQTFDFEYQPHWRPVPGLSLIADGAVGQHGAARVLFGVRYYFGDEKPLVDNHRRDTIDNTLIFDVKGLSKSRPGRPPPPPPPPPRPVVVSPPG